MKNKTGLKLRQGAYSALLCLLAAGICALAVMALDTLENRHGWRRDMSFNHITTGSAETRRVLAELTHDVRAYAVFSDGSEDQQLIALLNRYQAAGKRFTWSQENLLRNPTLLQWASDDIGDAAVSSDCLIVRCEETGRTRVLTGEDYIEYGYDSAQGAYGISGWQYEKSLTEAILYVTMDELPVVQILSGHGELTEIETAALEKQLADAFYDVRRVQLRQGDTLDPQSPLMILSPTVDIPEGELSLLMEFVQAGGAVFMTLDYADPGEDKLPNFYAFYRLYGFEPLEGMVVADTQESGSYYDYPTTLIPYMVPGDMTDPLIAAGADEVLLYSARAFENVESADESLLLSPVLVSGDGAYLCRATDGSIAKKEGDREGPFVLALSAQRIFGENVSRAFIIGNSLTFLDEWLYNYTYNGELLLHAMQYLRGRPAVSVQIASRAAVRAQLQADNPIIPVILLLTPVLIVAVLALGVLRPRKHL